MQNRHRYGALTQPFWLFLRIVATYESDRWKPALF